MSNVMNALPPVNGAGVAAPALVAGGEATSQGFGSVMQTAVAALRDLRLPTPSLSGAVILPKQPVPLGTHPAEILTGVTHAETGAPELAAAGFAAAELATAELAVAELATVGTSGGGPAEAEAVAAATTGTPAGFIPVSTSASAEITTSTSSEVSAETIPLAVDPADDVAADAPAAPEDTSEKKMLSMLAMPSVLAMQSMQSLNSGLTSVEGDGTLQSSPTTKRGQGALLSTASVASVASVAGAAAAMPTVQPISLTAPLQAQAQPLHTLQIAQLRGGAAETSGLAITLPSDMLSSPSFMAPVAATAPVAAAAHAAPAAPAQAPAPLPLTTQLVRPTLQLAALGTGEHTVTVSVTPDNLGPVTVRAIIGADGIRVDLFAASDTGREALRAILGDLRRDLAGAGAQASLNLSANDQPAGFGDRSAHRGDTDAGMARRPAAIDAEPEVLAMASPPISGATQLDLWA